MDGSKQLIPRVSMDGEIAILNELLAECEAFLLKWNFHKPYQSEAVPDAIIAIVILQQEVRVRLSYLLGWVHSEILPF